MPILLDVTSCVDVKLITYKLINKGKKKRKKGKERQTFINSLAASHNKRMKITEVQY